MKFHRLYISPFSEKQIERYLKRRFKFWRRDRRSQARTSINSVPHLTVRPMLLAYIDDLITLDPLRTQTKSELYEAMISGWLVREVPLLTDVAALRKFSSDLAVRLMAAKRLTDVIAYTFPSCAPCWARWPCLSRSGTSNRGAC